MKKTVLLDVDTLMSVLRQLSASKAKAILDAVGLGRSDPQNTKSAQAGCESAQEKIEDPL